MSLGNLPEMHVWIGILDRQEIVDFTTRYLKAAAADHGMAWTADDPPPYLWCPASATPDWVVYKPNKEATLYACNILNTHFHPIYLKPRGRK
jgi:hypothetical protein